MKGSIKRYCVCLDDAGKQLGTRCPDLTGKPKHGMFEYRDRLAATGKDREFRRRGFSTKKAAEEFRGRVYEMYALAKGDTQATARIGDLIFEKTKRGGELPAVDDVRRRLGLGRDLDRSQTVGEYLPQWLAGKRKLRDSVVRLYGGHIDHFLVPLLGHIPLDRLTAEHIADMLDWIEEWNSEIRTAHDEGRRPVLDKDVRKRSGIVDVATQRRIFATLRCALNAAWKTRRIDHNPCHFVEMPTEYREPARTWAPEQVAAFLDHCESTHDRLSVLFRLVLLHGLRRGEAVGARRSRFNHRTRDLVVARPLLQLGGKIVESRPKTRAGERPVVLDAGTADLVKREARERAKEKLAWGEAYEDNDLIFSREDGSPYPPDYVSRRFRELIAAAGLPRIKLHEGRHTAASLRLEAGVDIKVVSEGLGHSNTAITQNLYTHVRRVLHDQAAEAVVQLLPERPGRGAVAQ